MWFVIRYQYYEHLDRQRNLLSKTIQIRLENRSETNEPRERIRGGRRKIRILSRLLGLRRRKKKKKRNKNAKPSLLIKIKKLPRSSGKTMEEGDFFNCCFREINSGMTTNKKKMKKSNTQKRFSEEQIKSLEVIFESETRLEPRKKVQLARELGLQPRQVAIWFQNKRARWKSKQLEKEYNILRANYNNLASQFETMKKENQALVSELQRLNEEKQKSKEERNDECCGEQRVALSSTTGSENGKCEPEVMINQGIVLCNDEIKTEYFGFEEESNHELMNIVEQADDSCLTSSENWEGFSSDPILDQSSSNYPWWDFWS